MPKKQTYDEKSIKKFKGVSAVRKRPGMYVGGTDKNAVYRLFKEVLDNAIDEYQAGYNKKIFVWWYKNQMWIGDNGRGIPVKKNPKEKKSALTMVLTELHAGGKFDDKAYAVSSGLHGVGVTATNALSEWLQVYSNRGKKWYFQEFRKGVPVKKDPAVVKSPPKKIKNSAKVKGTIVGFCPDPSLMKTQMVDKQRMIDEITDISYLCPGLTFIVYDMEKKKKKKFVAEEGLKSCVEDYYKSTYQKTIFHATNKDRSVDVALLWGHPDEAEISSYVNCSETLEGGTHIDGLNRASASVLKRYGSEMESSDLRAGMSGVLHIRIKDPEYGGQTKEKLTNVEVEKMVFEFVKSELDKYFKKNPNVAKSIIRNAKILALARKKANVTKQALKAVKIEKKGKKGLMPGKLLECPNCSSKERELFIVEGDSAGGSVRDGRDKYYQEMLPLRGKINNAITTTQLKLLSGKRKDGELSEVQALITAVGTHIGQKQRIQNCRYNKILILTDADPDGLHIAALIIAFFMKYMDDVIKTGRLYLVKSPLFVGYHNNKRIFGNNIDKIRAKFPKNAKIQFSRLKGHGEVDPDELSQYALSPKSRKLVKVKWSNNSMEQIEELMGSDSSHRKKLLGV